jgi:hypothetical protein
MKRLRGIVASGIAGAMETSVIVCSLASLVVVIMSFMDHYNPSLEVSPAALAGFLLLIFAGLVGVQYLSLSISLINGNLIKRYPALMLDMQLRWYEEIIALVFVMMPFFIGLACMLWIVWDLLPTESVFLFLGCIVVFLGAINFKKVWISVKEQKQKDKGEIACETATPDLNRRKALKNLLMGFVHVSLVFFILHTALTIYAGRKEKEILSQWEKAGCPLKPGSEAFADEKDNDYARKLKGLADKLGVWDNYSKKKMNSGYKKVFECLNASLEKEGPEPVQFDQDTKDKINSLRTYIDDLCTIIDSGRPVWAYNKSNDEKYEVAILNFERLLCADSLLSLSEGNMARAAGDLHHGIVLAEYVDMRKGLIPSLVKIASYRLLLSSARFMPEGQDRLIEELSPMDPVSIMKEGYVREAANSFQTFNMPENLGGKELSRRESRFFVFVFSGYIKLSTADYLKHYLDLVNQLESADPCELSNIDLTKKIYNSIPKWNLVGRIALPNLQNSWIKANRAGLVKDLSLMILKVRSEKARNGKLPETIKLPPCVCQGASWQYTKKGEHFSINFKGILETKPKTEHQIPLKWEE